MKWGIEYFTKVTFLSVIIIASDLIGPNGTTRTRFRSKVSRRQQDMPLPEMQTTMEMKTNETSTEPAVMEMEMNFEEVTNSSSSDGMVEMSSNSNMNVMADESRDTRGIRGFLPGFNLGGGNSGNSGRGLFRGLKGGGGGGLFSGLGLGGKQNSGGNSGGNNNFPEFPSNNGGDSGGNGNSGWSQSETTTQSSHSGWSQSGSNDGGKGGGLFSSLPGASLFRNPFGRGKGRNPFRLLSRLSQDQPCAAGLSSLPILSKLPFIPQKRFPSFIPSGVNTCDATCDSGPGGGVWRRVPPTKEEKEQMGMKENNDNGCTYNWRESLMGLPFLLFRCQCKKCPPKKSIRIGGIFSSQCENVSSMPKTRCSCPYGQESYKCTIKIFPSLRSLGGAASQSSNTGWSQGGSSGGSKGGGLFSSLPGASLFRNPFGNKGMGRENRKKAFRPYYCTCCNPSSPSLESSASGGYDLSPVKASALQETQFMSAVEELGGYGYGGANSVSGTMSSEQGASSSDISQKELPSGRPLGSEHFYEHL